MQTWRPASCCGTTTSGTRAAPAERVLELLDRSTRTSAWPRRRSRAVTGTAAAPCRRPLGARFVQEVAAAVARRRAAPPRGGSVVELGGQDAKIILFDEDAGRARDQVASMNDKCAGGTGAVIDKIAAKLRIPRTASPPCRTRGVKVHPVAGKCGVFAETDINGLQKLGVPADELMASLFDAIVAAEPDRARRAATRCARACCSSAARTPSCAGCAKPGGTHRAAVGGARIVVPTGDLDGLIQAPPHAVYFAALGAVEFGRREDEPPSALPRRRAPCGGTSRLRAGGGEGASGRRRWSPTGTELAAFRDRYDARR